MKTYVDDDSGTPHVEAAIVALVSQHFRREVSRSSDHTFPETLFSDDPSESEIAQFDLKTKKGKIISTLSKLEEKKILGKKIYKQKIKIHYVQLNASIFDKNKSSLFQNI